MVWNVKCGFQGLPLILNTLTPSTASNTLQLLKELDCKTHFQPCAENIFVKRGRGGRNKRGDASTFRRGRLFCFFKIATIITITALCTTATTKYFTQPVLWVYSRLTCCFWTTTWRAMTSCPRYKIVQIKDNILKSAEDPCRNEQLLPLC